MRSFGQFASGFLAGQAGSKAHRQGRIYDHGADGEQILSFFVTTVMVGWLGIAALNVQQVATRYLMLLVILFVGLSQAATDVTSRHFGGRRLGAAKQVGDVYARMGVIYSLIVLAAFALVPSLFVRVFDPGPPKNAGIYHMLSIILVLIAIGRSSTPRATH